MREKEKNIRRDLLCQLEHAGKNTAYFRDMVDFYMDLWKMREECRKDIAKRGREITTEDLDGREWTKPNPALAEFKGYGPKMMAVLKAMGLNGPAYDDDDEEL